MSHQLQKHTSDVHSDLVPRELLARHNWVKQKAFLALSEHISLSDGSAAPLSYGHRDSFALKMLMQARPLHCGLGACSLKWSQRKVKS